MKIHINRIVDKNFKLSNGLTFKIIDAEPCPTGEVNSEYRRVINLRSNYLVGFKYNKILIPHIIAEGDIFKVVGIEIEKEKFIDPATIIEQLRISNDVTPHIIQRVESILEKFKRFLLNDVFGVLNWFRPYGY